MATAEVAMCRSSQLTSQRSVTLKQQTEEAMKLTCYAVALWYSDLPACKLNARTQIHRCRFSALP